jgi:hypothetical protein
MDEVATTVEAPAAPPPPPASDHAAELTEIRESLARLEKAGEYEIPALQDSDSGRQKSTYAGAHDSARYLARRRREAAAQPDAPPPEPSGVDLEIGYTDNRPEVSARQAATDLADYRARMAAQLLEGVDPTTAALRAGGQQQEAPQPVEQPVAEQSAEQPQPSEKTHFSRAEVEAAAVQQLQDYRDRVGAILLSIRGVGVPPELAAAIQNPQAWAALQAADPHKAAQIADYIQRRAGMAQQLESELGAVRQQQQEIQSAHFQKYASEEDAKFEKHAGTVSRELQVEALTTLKDVGLEEREIAAAWNGAPVSLRSAAAQRLVLDATRWRLAQEKARTAVQRPVPQVQRPGVRMPDRTSAQVEADRLSKQLDSNRGEGLVGLRTAAALVSQRRLARG